ncbi:class I SAM-dependent methyltransferase [Sinimarinibacterium sp. NLF-5-8]|uniref:methyltransferase domain-containing protein n=1 Tax=Sinimarinibacterium sp. NLF-5-8 TaxID=2698684 RepID=UPI00137C2C88|nr:class I SAM-dependent methyltransferase [Sinimarinibacterium sp. NLF-5-8]QHS09344.1 class I SAM-dependent methyltransferase [Sinimarinibacterium sp. NLF-5-8]
MSEIELHRKLLGDSARNQAFHQALKSVIRPEKTTVLDIGAGTGFLSFLAHQLGAAHCTLMEYADTLELAQTLARANGMDRLTFIQTVSLEWRRKLSVDVVVSETLGNFALEEGFLETAVDARRFLKPGGALLPYALRQFAMPVIGDRLQREIDIWPEVGFGLDLNAARAVSLSNMYVKDVQPQDLPSPSCAQCWDDLDLRPSRPPPSSKRTHTLRWSAADLGARVAGFALWWEADLTATVKLSTSPFDPPTHWQQIYLPLLSALTLQAQDQVELTLTCDTRAEVGVRLIWQTTQLRAGQVIHQQKQDSFRGQL